MNLYEKYRPGRWEEVLGQDKAVTRVRHHIKRGLGGKAFWITGNSGTGKSTIAYLIAKEFGPLSTETTGRELSPAFLEEWFRSSLYVPMMGTGHTLIVNESHGMSKPVIEFLLQKLEEMARGDFSRALVIFTTTCDGDTLFDDKTDGGPFGSRVFDVPLARRDLSEVFAARALEIARAEGLDGQPIEKYVRLTRDCKNNFRLVLQKIENLEMMQ